MRPLEPNPPRFRNGVINKASWAKWEAERARMGVIIRTNCIHHFEAPIEPGKPDPRCPKCERGQREMDHSFRRIWIAFVRGWRLLRWYL